MLQADLEAASKAVDSFAKLTRKLRKHGMLVSALKMIKTPNYQKYSDCESSETNQLNAKQLTRSKP